MREDFRPILGYEGHYEINSEGVIVSLKRGKRRIMKSRLNLDGYHTINLHLVDKGRTKFVHRLVWEAFNGKIEDNLLVLHGEGTTRDHCCLESLSLGTVQDNNGRDRRRDGTTPQGERNGTAKLTNEQVKYIKQRIRDNEKLVVLARLFEVTSGVIKHIKSGRQWSHVA